MRLKDIINIGSEGLQEKELGKVRLTNFLGALTIFASTMYLAFYIVVMAKEAIGINLAVIICYGLTFLFNHLRWYRFAKNWLFSVYMIHVFVLTAFIFTKETGFHYFYFVVPPTVFLMFEYEDMADKIFLSILSIILFYSCEIFIFHEPYIHLSQAVNQMLFLSTISANFFGMFFVVYLFTRDIKEVETVQEKLIEQLKSALNEIKQLRGIIPICANCKKIRDDKGYWNQIESYIENHSEAEFSHGICPDCAKELYPDIDIYD